MISFLLHILQVVWRARVEWFFQIWILVTGVAAIGVAWVIGPATTLTPARPQGAMGTPARRYGHSISAIAALTLVILILLAYLVLALKWEDFADYDDAYFTLYSLRGRDFGPPIWASSGRFFPFGHQEFNLIRHFTSSVAGYHAVPLAQLLIVSCILLLLDDVLSITARAALTAVFLILPSTVTIFTGLIFPDRNVVFWLACLVFLIRLFEQTRSTAWAVAAVICAQIIVYYKETAFLLVLGFAVARLILRSRRPDGKGWDYDRLRDRSSRLDLSLISVGLFFLLYYASVMIHHPNMQYADRYGVSWDKALLFYLRLDPLGILFCGLALQRAYLIFHRRLEPSLLWDGLAFGGVACYSAYLYLRLCMPYYLAPVDFIAVLYVGRFVILSWQKMPLWSKGVTFVLVFALLLQSVSLSAFRVYERENVIHAKAELAGAIAARSLNDTSHIQRLFFPFAGVYPVTEFASYLVYRGIQVEGEETKEKSVAPNGVVIVSSAFTKDGPCVDYRNFVCHAASGPASGDLVIELPDDFESFSEITPYRRGGEMLFFHEPHPRIPQWMNPLLRQLRVVSSGFRFREIPDRWLQTSMTRWK
jgi:hypothetical protein